MPGPGLPQICRALSSEELIELVVRSTYMLLTIDYRLAEMSAAQELVVHLLRERSNRAKHALVRRHSHRRKCKEQAAR